MNDSDPGLIFQNAIQLSPEGEVNSGGYIYRDAKHQGIYPLLFTDPGGIVPVIVVLVFTKSDGYKNAVLISSSETFTK